MRYCASRADSPGDRIAAYRIRHECYLRENYISPKDNEQFSDEFDLQENCETVLLHDESGSIVGSARLSLLDCSSPLRIPAQSCFPAEIASLMWPEDYAWRAVEINRLVCRDFAKYKSFSARLLALYKSLADHSLIATADLILACVREEHLRLYNRFGFLQIAGPKLYHSVRFEVYLLCLFRQGFNALWRMLKVLQ